MATLEDTSDALKELDPLRNGGLEFFFPKEERGGRSAAEDSASGVDLDVINDATVLTVAGSRAPRHLR